MEIAAEFQNPSLAPREEDETTEPTDQRLTQRPSWRKRGKGGKAAPSWLAKKWEEGRKNNEISKENLQEEEEALFSRHRRDRPNIHTRV